MKFFKWLSALVWGVGCISNAGASVVIDTTRVIYPEHETEVSVRLTNKGETPKLVQAWIDDGDEKTSPEKIYVPFVILTPIFRMEADKGQVLRIRYTGSASLPKDKESVFWLNVLEIPPKPSEEVAAENYLQFSFRTRIKLFLRPHNLPGNATEAPDQLTWQYQQGALLIDNPSAFHVSIREAVVGKDAEGGSAESIFLKPFSKTFVTLSGGEKLKQPPVIFFSAINDFGGSPKRMKAASLGRFSVGDVKY